MPLPCAAAVAIEGSSCNGRQQLQRKAPSTLCRDLCSTPHARQLTRQQRECLVKAVYYLNPKPESLIPKPNPQA